MREYNYSYSNPCGGNYTEYTMPMDFCMQYTAGNVTGVKYTKKVTSGVTCATIDLYEGANCSQGTFELDYAFPCDVCHKDVDPKIGYYRWECHQQHQYVKRHVGCDANCNNCTNTTIIGAGGCQNYPGTTKEHSLKLVKIYSCGYVEEEQYMASSKTNYCLGAASPNPLVFGFCYYGTLVYLP